MSASKYLLFSSEFPPQPGGIGNHAWQLATHLHQNGREVTVLTDSRGATSWESETAFDHGLPFSVIRIPRQRPLWRTYLNRIRRFWQLAGGADKVLVSGKFPLWVGGASRVFFPKKQVTAILHGSELGFPGTWKGRWNAFCLRQMDYLIAVSAFTQARARALAPHQAITVINNGFEPPATVPEAARLAGFPALITVGNLTRRKGQHQVIRALPTLARIFPEVHYHLVGLPTDKTPLIELAHELGVEDRLTLHGPVEDTTKWALLAGATVFIMLSEVLPDGDLEGFGIAVPEANYLGLPAIGSRGCGLEDAIRDGYSGHLVDPANAQAVADALRNIMDNYASFRAQAQQWCAQFYWSNKIADYLNI